MKKRMTDVFFILIVFSLISSIVKLFQTVSLSYLWLLWILSRKHLASPWGWGHALLGWGHPHHLLPMIGGGSILHLTHLLLLLHLLLTHLHLSLLLLEALEGQLLLVLKIFLVYGEGLRIVQGLIAFQKLCYWNDIEITSENLCCFFFFFFFSCHTSQVNSTITQCKFNSLESEAMPTIMGISSSICQ